VLNIKDYEAMAMLDLSDDEREPLSGRLGTIADGFTTLEQIDTDGIKPLVTVLDRHNVLREDVAAKLLTRDEILSNAPESYDGFFQVPGTLG